MAQRDYQSAHAELSSLLEEVGFSSEITLLQTEQAHQTAAQMVQVALQDLESKRLALELARTTLSSAIRKLQIAGRFGSLPQQLLESFEWQ